MHSKKCYILKLLPLSIQLLIAIGPQNGTMYNLESTNSWGDVTAASSAQKLGIVEHVHVFTTMHACINLTPVERS